MKMTLRWFGKDFDSVTLQQIRQIPGVTGVITTLYDIPAGDVWPIERIKAMQAEVEAEGLKVEKSILTTILKLSKTLASVVLIWFATTLCLYLTGHVLNLLMSEKTVQQFSITTRQRLTKLTQKKCLILLTVIQMVL